MSEKTKFWVLLGLFIMSIALVVVLNSAMGQDILVESAR
jgi:hypothetical protein